MATEAIIDETVSGFSASVSHLTSSVAMIAYSCSITPKDCSRFLQSWQLCSVCKYNSLSVWLQAFFGADAQCASAWQTFCKLKFDLFQCQHFPDQLLHSTAQTTTCLLPLAPPISVPMSITCRVQIPYFIIGIVFFGTTCSVTSAI